MNHVFVAPHPDDVALSCGGLIAALRARGDQVAVVTVFSGIGDAGSAVLTDYQREALGFGRAAELGADRSTTTAEWSDAGPGAGVADDIRRVRASEDDAYARLLGVRVVRLDLPDAVYRGYEGDDQLFGRVHPAERAPVEPLRHALAGLDHGRLYAPLGVGGHVDHALCRDAAVSVIGPGPQGQPPDLWLYEDFPYAWRIGFRGPAEAGDRGRETSGDGGPAEAGDRGRETSGDGGREASDARAFLEAGRTLRARYVDVTPWLDRKAEGIRAYASQIGRQFDGVGGMVGALREYHGRVAAEGGMAGFAERYWVPAEKASDG
ncbi:MAG: PIG-L family deacetylase [Chloroflexi bacterium]|nr:PIG-L family deacetylase [Chloroflexota bacterium]